MADTVGIPALIWDAPDNPPEGSGYVLLWRSYSESPMVNSVPAYLDRHGDRLRARYIEFIHDLGESIFAGKSIAEHLDSGKGFSFWWMTHLAEKSPFKSRGIFNCLRLLALEEMLKEKGVTRVSLVCSDRNLIEAIRRTCRSLGIDFLKNALRYQIQPWSLKRFYKGLPYILQGILSLRHLVPRWRLRE